MKDSERISNLEEMTAEILMRLDRIDTELVRLQKGQSQAIGNMDSIMGRMDSMEEIMRELATSMFKLNDRQTMVEETMRDIYLTNRLIFERMATKDDLEAMATKDDLDAMATKDDLKAMATKDDLEAMATRDDLIKLFDYMADRFNKSDARFDEIDKRLDHLEKRIDGGQPYDPQS